jgi:hypothetical protein
VLSISWQQRPVLAAMLHLPLRHARHHQHVQLACPALAQEATVVVLTAAAAVTAAGRPMAVTCSKVTLMQMTLAAMMTSLPTWQDNLLP